MIFITRENDDGEWEIELDREGIEYLIDGLNDLLLCDPGEKISTPSFIEDDNGLPGAATDFILYRSPHDLAQ